MNDYIPEEVLEFVEYTKSHTETTLVADSEVRVFKNATETLKVFNEWVESLTNQDTTNNPHAVLHLREADLNFVSGLVQATLADIQSYLRGRMLEILEEGMNK